MTRMLSQEITRLRKAGQLKEAWDIGCPAVQEDSDNIYLKSAFFWVCYAYLKELQSGITDRATQSNNTAPTFAEIEKIYFYLDWIVWLNIRSGGPEYRALMLLFQKNLESIPRLVLLLARFSSHLFDKAQGDHQPYKGDKGESPSLIIKFARKVAKAWLEHDEVRQFKIDDLCNLFSYARNEALDTQHLIWLDYDEAKCLIFAGKFLQARNRALAVLRRKPTETWAWSALATTYRKDDPNTAIVLFSRAVSSVREESFALPALKNLALLLADQGFGLEASMCVKRAVNCYVHEGWKIRPDLEQLTRQPWYDSDADPTLLVPFLKMKSEGASDFLHGEVERYGAVIHYLHPSRKGFNVYYGKDKSIPIRIGLYRSKRPPKPGDYVQITLSKDDKTAISVEPCDPLEIPDVSHQEGILSVKAAGFGFVEDTYVPQDLVSPDLDGVLVKVLRLLDFDKRKCRHGFKAITIKAV